MTTRTRSRLSDEERAERRERERELTVRAVAQLRSSPGWQAWLRVRARTGIRRYSVTNQLLVALQDPDATRVAGFRAWLALGYCVRRGERSRIAVWARCEPSKKRLQAWRDAGAVPGDRPKGFFKLEPVFDRAQVDALPAPAVPAPLDPPIAAIDGDSLAWALPALETFAETLGVTVVWASLRDGLDGSYVPRTRQVTINRSGAVNQQAAALAHELAHALVRLDHQAEDPALDYATEELVAESVAVLVCGFLGLDTAGNSVGYLAVWSEHAAPDAFERIAGLTDRLARRLEDALQPAPAHAGEAVADGRAG